MPNNSPETPSAHTTAPHTSTPPNAPARLLGVGTLKTDTPHTLTSANIHFGTDLHAHLTHAPKSLDKEMSLVLLHMPEIMKKATIAALRNSAARQAGEHIDMPLSTPDEVRYETSRFNDSLPRHARINAHSSDPLATSAARLHELKAHMMEHLEQNIFELKSTIHDAVQMLREGKNELACTALEDAQYIAARNMVILKRHGVSMRDAKSLTYDIMTDLLDDAIFTQRKGPFHEGDYQRNAAIATSMLDMFFTRQSALSGH